MATGKSSVSARKNHGGGDQKRLRQKQAASSAKFARQCPFSTVNQDNQRHFPYFRARNMGSDSDFSLDAAAEFETFGERHPVRVLEVAAHRNAERDPCYLHAALLQQL